ncbi:hypothetical protein, partial [Herbaspirillum frisingense]|uniref:hypothetical protein n=1 Tax=Herbaspirillum frisingense TaxID=92645 RepID=UPI0039B0E2A5
GREAARHDALDQGQQAGRSKQELICHLRRKTPRFAVAFFFAPAPLHIDADDGGGRELKGHVVTACCICSRTKRMGSRRSAG